MRRTNTNIKQTSRIKAKEIKRIIYNAMLKLSEEDYEILHELYFNRISIHQLSKQLGISRPSVRWRRDRALTNLKKIITKLPK